MSPNGEQPLNRSLVVFKDAKERRDLERKVLSAAFKLSFEGGDTDGAAVAHKGLCTILQAQLFEGDGSSTGSVIPASVWQRAQTDEEPAAASAATSSETEKASVAPSSGQENAQEVTAADAQMLAFEAAVQRVLEDGLEATVERPAYSTGRKHSAADEHSDADKMHPGDSMPTIGKDGEEQPLAMPVTEKPLFEAPTPQTEPVPEQTTVAASPEAESAESEAEPSESEAEPSESEEPSIAMPVMEKPLFEAPTPQLETQPEVTSGAQSDRAEAESLLEQLAMAPDTVAEHSHDEQEVEESGEQQVVAATEPELEPAGLDEMPFDAEMEPSAAAIAEMLEKSAAMEAPPAAPIRMSPSQLIKQQSYYQILGVNKLSSFELIHKRYWKIMRRLLRNRYAENSQIRDLREFREVLRAICVAHDVLKDPVTRTDYDLRQLGMRNAEQIETPADDKPVGIVPRTRLMLGELLECANILEPAELQMAVDMHKTEPHLNFGEFLVRANFISQDMLDASMLGQKLVSSGKITIAQFQAALFRMRDHGTAFLDTMMVEGWLTPADIFDESSTLFQATPAPPQEGADAAAAASDASHKGNGDNGNSAPPEMVPPMSQEAVALARSEKGACNDTQAIDVRDWRAALRSDDSD